ncbi:MAG: cytochrome c3 family protein [Acidobacteriota bacterium]
MRRQILTVAAALLLAAATGFAQATIATGPHDLSAGSALRNGNASINGQTCVFCHTPHGANLNSTAPLWNRNNVTSTYQVYSSSTMDAAAPSSAQIAGSVSGACMSCHDGSIAVDVLVNLNGAAFGPAVAFTVQGAAKATYGNVAPGSNNLMTGGIPAMGTDLRNDHPITIIYQTARLATPTEFVTETQVGSKIYVASGTGDLPLYGAAAASATVECGSCHNPHNNTQGSFLRKSNATSAICTTCHIK